MHDKKTFAKTCEDVAKVHLPFNPGPVYSRTYRHFSEPPTQDDRLSLLTLELLFCNPDDITVELQIPSTFLTEFNYALSHGERMCLGLRAEAAQAVNTAT
jgi:hypothetical protein